MKQQTRAFIVTAIIFVFFILLGLTPSGHAPIASRWNYNEHLFPIFRDRCGGCHIQGGIAPMSLVDYQQAFPWAQSIREEVLNLRMPPWQAEDGFGSFLNGHALSAKEMDMILEWSSGGYPRGPRDKIPIVPELSIDWSFGKPSIELKLPEPYFIERNTDEIVRYFIILNNSDRERWIEGIDFKPGAQSLVRGISLFVDTSGLARSLDKNDASSGFSEEEGQSFPTTPPIAIWRPGQSPLAKRGVGYYLSQGSDLVLRVHYKKTWLTQGYEFFDQTRVGLYFSEISDQISSVVVTSPENLQGNEVSFDYEVKDDITLLALFPEILSDSSMLKVEVTMPNGLHVPLLWLRRPDLEWPTRFWLDKPVVIRTGSLIKVTALLDVGSVFPYGVSLLGINTNAPIRLAIDFVDGVLERFE